MDKLDDAVERLKRIQKREAEKAKAAGQPSNITPIKRRVIESSVLIRGRLPEELLYQHTLFCQTVLPFRDPGPDVRVWEREQGRLSLRLEAGYIKKPRSGYQPIGLPFGPTARLILCHLNTEALRSGEPIVEIEGSMTAFVQRLQGFAPNGAQIRRFKDQAARLSSSLIRLAVENENGMAQVDTKIVEAFDVWKDKSEGEQLTFPSRIELSPSYFKSLQEHAVPLDERAICALAHSAMALDVYCWLAQRLHRIDPRRAQLVTWQNLHEQFGQGFKDIRFFRRKFLGVLKLVHTQYPTASLNPDHKGLWLGNSPPPVQRRAVLVGAPPPKLALPPPIPNADMLTFQAHKKPRA